MAEESDAVHDDELLDTILPLVPRLPERLKAGIDVAEPRGAEGERHALGRVGPKQLHGHIPEGAGAGGRGGNSPTCLS